MWNDNPTPSQIRTITNLCIIKKIYEPLEERVSNRAEARSLIYQLRSYDNLNSKMCLVR